MEANGNAPEAGKNTVPENNSKNSTVNAAPTNSSSKVTLIIVIVLLVLAGLIYLFIRLSPETTQKIRDISIILYVLETIITVTAVSVLVVQIAKLVNFLRYEIAPILNTTDKTVKKLSGTVSFLCDNAVEPTVEAASTVSGIRNAVDGFLSIFRK